MVPSLKNLTNWSQPKRKGMYLQSSIFRCYMYIYYVRFREGRICCTSNKLKKRRKSNACDVDACFFIGCFHRLYHVLVPFGKLAVTSFRPWGSQTETIWSEGAVCALGNLSNVMKDQGCMISFSIPSPKSFSGSDTSNLMRHCSGNFILERCQETQIVLWNLSKLQREVLTKGIIFDSYLINKCMCPNDFSQKLVYTLDTP